MNIIAWLYINLWLRPWIHYWKGKPDYEPNGFPIMKSLYIPRWLQPHVIDKLSSK